MKRVMMVLGCVALLAISGCKNYSSYNECVKGTDIEFRADRDGVEVYINTLGESDTRINNEVDLKATHAALDRAWEEHLKFKKLEGGK